MKYDHLDECSPEKDMFVMTLAVVHLTRIFGLKFWKRSVKCKLRPFPSARKSHVLSSKLAINLYGK